MEVVLTLRRILLNHSKFLLFYVDVGLRKTVTRSLDMNKFVDSFARKPRPFSCNVLLWKHWQIALHSCIDKNSVCKPKTYNFKNSEEDFSTTLSRGGLSLSGVI